MQVIASNYHVNTNNIMNDAWVRDKARLSDFASLGKYNVLELLKRQSFYILPPNGRKSYEKGFFKVTSTKCVTDARVGAVQKKRMVLTGREKDIGDERCLTKISVVHVKLHERQ